MLALFGRCCRPSSADALFGCLSAFLQRDSPFCRFLMLLLLLILSSCLQQRDDFIVCASAGEKLDSRWIAAHLFLPQKLVLLCKSKLSGCLRCHLYHPKQQS